MARQNRKKTDRLLTYKPRARLSVNLGLGTRTKRTITAVILITLAVIAALALVGLAGPLGAWIIRAIMTLFGLAGYLLPIALGLAGYWMIKDEPKDKENATVQETPSSRVLYGLLLTWLGFAGLLHLAASTGESNLWVVASSGNGGGYFGAFATYIFLSTLGTWVAGLILTAITLIGILIAANWAPKFKKTPMPATTGAVSQSVPILSAANFIATKVKTATNNIKINQTKPTDSQKEDVTKNEDKQSGLQINTSGPVHEDWKMPPFDLLEAGGAKADSGNIEAGAAIIQQTLKNFNIEVEMGEVNQGPTVTQYTLRPATGVKLSQIAALKQDLALALAAKSLRMELPIPGKALVGIEVPNRSIALVTLRSVLETSEFINNKSPLAFALGEDVAGRTQVADLTKLPHLLIAGATGSGKSVAINTFIISLLYHNSPRSVKLIMVDPKRVELTLYQGLPHLLTAPITAPDKAVNALRWAVAEMDRRYERLSEVGKRNIAEFNAVSADPLSYIVIIVDELADLMAVAGNDIETVIVRLAQMARAVGIHLVLATQRPSVDILTGLIKANITARIAFAVASQIDSRTILDSSGAEQLLGNGDMLFISADQAKPRRIQGAYLGEAEIRRVVDFCKRQVGAVIYNDAVIQKKQPASNPPGIGEDMDAEDELLEEARQEVVRAGKASASLLQRRLRIGYSRAARLLDLLEASGIVGPSDGAKPREVFGSQSPPNEDEIQEQSPDNGDDPDNHESP